MIKKFLYILILVIPLTNTVFAQMIIAKPTLGYTQACANPTFNTFDIQINFSVSPALDPTNQFIIELSSPDGDFSSPTIIHTTAAGEIKNTGDKTTVSFPETISGEKYQIRIRSTAPAAINGPQKSNAFAAYYKPHDTQYTINNAIPNATYCAGGSYILSVDPNGNGVTNSPLQFPSLTYNWFKYNGPMLPETLVATASSNSYTVTSPGSYFVKTNYGACTSDSGSYSNIVEVFQSATSASASITSSQGNPFCPSEGATTLTAITGNSYQWFKDDVKIDGATTKSYQATVAGKYDVKVDFGGCQATASIELQGASINSTIDVPDINVIEEGDVLIVTATTDAPSPTYQWYLNNNPIAGETSNVYELTTSGSYKIIISQAGTCNINEEIPFVVRLTSESVNIPNLISPNGDLINDTWDLPQEYLSGSDTNVIVISASGDIVLQTDNYLNDWPSTDIDFKNINPVYYYIITTKDNKMIKGSITVIK
ncbi:hypothetical protein HNQ02_000851 [Flavobacterium sp. 7E]|uniref:T9SS type B sorting domain-containing protein n=1 Tax=Flavobacterium sp. 7E TaxID=2735898 RepID=UPI001C2D2CA8|nr:gliding motility-associated C-terminal domain-containing protein [Flavobacterium sp. 7E]NRS87941.1 hypothetical protein [Flavobacterium sp. 7E]